MNISPEFSQPTFDRRLKPRSPKGEERCAFSFPHLMHPFRTTRFACAANMQERSAASECAEGKKAQQNIPCMHATSQRLARMTNLQCLFVRQHFRFGRLRNDESPSSDRYLVVSLRCGQACKTARYIAHGERGVLLVARTAYQRDGVAGIKALQHSKQAAMISKT